MDQLLFIHLCFALQLLYQNLCFFKNRIDWIFWDFIAKDKFEFFGDTSIFLQKLHLLFFHSNFLNSSSFHIVCASLYFSYLSSTSSFCNIWSLKLYFASVDKSIFLFLITQLILHHYLHPNSNHVFIIFYRSVFIYFYYSTPNNHQRFTLSNYILW